MLHLVVGLAALLAFAAAALAAEPVRRIGIYVQPYYEAARTPGERPPVAVGKQFNDQLASLRRQTSSPCATASRRIPSW